MKREIVLICYLVFTCLITLVTGGALVETHENYTFDKDIIAEFIRYYLNSTEVRNTIGYAANSPSADFYAAPHSNTTGPTLKGLSDHLNQHFEKNADADQAYDLHKALNLDKNEDSNRTYHLSKALHLDKNEDSNRTYHLSKALHLDKYSHIKNNSHFKNGSFANNNSHSNIFQLNKTYRPSTPVFSSLDHISHHIIPATINEIYIYNVSKTDEYLFEYTYNTTQIQNYALRVTISAPKASSELPVLVVVRQQRETLSWQMPLPAPPSSRQTAVYTDVSRTLCPVGTFKYQSHIGNFHARTVHGAPSTADEVDEVQRLSVLVSTQSSEALNYVLSTDYFFDFELRIDVEKTIVVSPPSPQYMEFNFPAGVDTVLVLATSNTTICGALTVQNKTCPVWDLEETMRYSDLFQTMSRRAAITVRKSMYPKGFYVTLMTLTTDEPCDGQFQSFLPDRNKMINIVVSEKITAEEFLLSLVIASVFIAVIYVITAVKWLVDRTSAASTLSRLGPTPSSSPIMSRRRRLTQGEAADEIRVPSAAASARSSRQRQSQYSVTDSCRTTVDISSQSNAYDRLQLNNDDAGSSVATAGVGSATVILGDERRFDDRDELQRELEESMSAMQHPNPTMATETEEYVLGYTSSEDEADSAQGDASLSLGDSRSRGDALSQHEFDAATTTDWPNSSGYGAVVGNCWSRPHGQQDDVESPDDNIRAVAIVQPNSHARVSPVDASFQQGSQPALRADKMPDDRLGYSRIQRNVLRVGQSLCIKDMTQKRGRVLKRRSRRYLTTLVSSFIFYFVPVLQLVTTYLKVWDDSGNQDICYYNFECANPYLGIADFNHVFSNVVYIALGILFSIIVLMRQRRYNLEVRRDPNVSRLGIPRDFGLFYSMGLALMMEGALSASYHICPNRTNFQFDTAFMYVIAIMLMLKLYQQRHQDIIASADSVFIALSVSVLLGVIGGLFGATWFWVLSCCVHFFMCSIVTAYVYYLGRWSFIRTAHNLYKTGGLSYLWQWICSLVRDWRQWRSLKSQFGTRVALLLIAFVSNTAMNLFGFIHRPKDYDTYLLGVFLLNLVIYVVFYLFMKTGYREHLSVKLKLTLTALLLVWTTGIAIFFQHTTDWSTSAANSRNLNKPCIMLNFYDWHDIWHMISALALFLSFNLIFIIDDDLEYVPRDIIAVF